MTEAGATPDQDTAQWVLGMDTLPISEQDYLELCAKSDDVSRRLREEVLFDQLATNVVEWHEAMVRFASRLSAGAVVERATWIKAERECSLMLRIANVLSAAFSFTEAVERDERHREHRCGNAFCTIARELRNRLQHDVLGSIHRYGPPTAACEAPGVPKVVGIRVRWRDVRKSIENARMPESAKEKRKKQFEDACSSEFQNLDEIDVFTVINKHLQCLSTVMRDLRKQEPPDELLAIHKRLSQQAESSQQGEPWNRRVVSPSGKTVDLRLAENNVDQIRNIMSSTDRLPDLELVQFGEGVPIRGG